MVARIYEPDRREFDDDVVDIGDVIQQVVDHIDSSRPDDIDRLNEAFVRGDLTLNQYIAKLETLEKLAKDRTDQDT